MLIACFLSYSCSPRGGATTSPTPSCGAQRPCCRVRERLRCGGRGTDACACSDASSGDGRAAAARVHHGRIRSRQRTHMRRNDPHGPDGTLPRTAFEPKTSFSIHAGVQHRAMAGCEPVSQRGLQLQQPQRQRQRRARPCRRLRQRRRRQLRRCGRPRTNG